MRPDPSILVLLRLAARLAFTAGLASGCHSRPRSFAPTMPIPEPPESVSIPDGHSFAEPNAVTTRHVSLDLHLDFAARTLAGNATLDLVWKAPTANRLVLDTRDLAIARIESSHGDRWSEIPFRIDAADPVLGSRLVLETPDRPSRVRITYRTSPDASGLQWLTPAMTLGKKSPFMFSQSQQIHARSWVPLQDTASVRFTYDARVSAPTNVMVLMSADNNPRARRTGTYTFRMPQPVPSYLLAIAAGDLVFQPITRRIGIWAEPEMAPKAAWEFADTGRMMETAERLYGTYRWDRYDILVLPPSFPYGGMENPRLTFASPTVITGDRSLVSLVAHELAHSWSGNLVTFSANYDMWLNEGFTTYVEARIVEDLFGRERADMDNLTSRNELAAEFTDDNRALQRLAIRPSDLPDPDGHLTATVYTKGAWFLEFLEHRFGRAAFDAFLRGYFDRFAFRSISTADFVDYASRHLLEKHPGKVTRAEFDTWLYEPGIPPTAPKTTSPRLEAVDTARKIFLEQGTLPPAVRTGAWTTLEWVHFLAEMPPTLSAGQLRALDTSYRLSGTPNAEIAKQWYPLAIRSGYLDARPAIAEYLGRVGRRRMVMSTYQALAKTPEGRAFALEVFTRARESMHPITAKSVAAALADPTPSPAP